MGTFKMYGFTFIHSLNMNALQEKMRKAEDTVKDHLLYLDAVHEFTDWLHSAKEELHRWSDESGDSAAMQKKLVKIYVRPFTTRIY